MGEALMDIAESHLVDAGGYVLVEFGHGTTAEISAIYRAFAVRCITEQLKRVMVKPGDEDFAGERALRDAFTMILLAGIAPGFRIAIVAGEARVEARYRVCVHDLRLANVDAQLFDDRDKAVSWLTRQGGSVQRAA
jgi:hypothetical protein